MRIFVKLALIRDLLQHTHTHTQIKIFKSCVEYEKQKIKTKIKFH